MLRANLIRNFDQRELRRVVDYREIARIAGDKLTTYEFLRDQDPDIKMPETHIFSAEALQTMLAANGEALLKPRHGSGGEGIYIVHKFDEVRPFDHSDYVVQKRIKTPVVDGVTFVIHTFVQGMRGKAPPPPLLWVLFQKC